MKLEKPVTHGERKHKTAPVTVRRWEHGAVHEVEDQVAEECAIALVYNGISHAVMMATPEDLEEFAVGFSLSEGIVQHRDEIFDTQVKQRPQGMEVNLTIAAAQFAKLKQRRRSLTGRTGCGLCGAESLQQAIRPIEKVAAIEPIDATAIQAAQQQFTSRQPMQLLTGAMHGAAWCDRNGDIVLLREDVGRHNALDKLIGAMAGLQLSVDNGFVMISSRISYEMVQKTSAAGATVLAAVSAPTRLAIELADAAGIALVAFVRQDRHAIYTHPQYVHAAVQPTNQE